MYKPVAIFRFLAIQLFRKLKNPKFQWKYVYMLAHLYELSFSLKFVMKIPLAPIKLNLWGSARPKNAIWWSKFSKNEPKNAFFGLFFQNFVAQKICG